MNQSKPLFSIITACYNAEDTIERTILSVTQQTYAQLEYIIIDGASKDKTLEIINRYKDSIHTLISEPDKGLYDAMNKAIELAQGEYLCFLNAGDKFHQNKTLELIAHQLDHTSTLPDVIYGNTAIVDTNGEFVRMRRLSPPKHLTWESFKQGMLVCHQSFIPRTELVPKYDLTYRYSSDFDWCIQILKKATSTLFTEITQVDYLQEGLTTDNQKKSLIERFKIMSTHYGLCSTICYHFGFMIRHIIKK